MQIVGLSHRHRAIRVISVNCFIDIIVAIGIVDNCAPPSHLFFDSTSAGRKQNSDSIIFFINLLRLYGDDATQTLRQNRFLYHSMDSVCCVRSFPHTQNIFYKSFIQADTDNNYVMANFIQCALSAQMFEKFCSRRQANVSIISYLFNLHHETMATGRI